MDCKEEGCFNRSKQVCTKGEQSTMNDLHQDQLLDLITAQQELIKMLDKKLLIPGKIKNKIIDVADKTIVVVKNVNKHLKEIDDKLLHLQKIDERLLVIEQGLKPKISEVTQAKMLEASKEMNHKLDGKQDSKDRIIEFDSDSPTGWGRYNM